eukprot:3294689-Rhodomonas_salina.1
MFPKLVRPLAILRPLATSLGPDGPDSLTVPSISAAHPQPDVPSLRVVVVAEPKPCMLVLVVWVRYSHSWCSAHDWVGTPALAAGFASPSRVIPSHVLSWRAAVNAAPCSVRSRLTSRLLALPVFPSVLGFGRNALANFCCCFHPRFLCRKRPRDTSAPR